MKHRIAVVALLVAALAMVFSGLGLAQTGEKRVGVVIQFADGQVHKEVVSIPADGTVADALQRLSLPVTLTTTDWGIALCAISDTGCPADNCFCDQEHFWAFYVQQEGQWVAASVGVGDYTPQDGEVVGFAWSGFDANYNPTVQPPFFTFEELAGGTQGAVPVVPLVVGAAILGAVAAGAILVYRRRAA